MENLEKNPDGAQKPGPSGETLQDRILRRLSDLQLTAYSAARSVGGSPDLIRNVLRGSPGYKPHPRSMKNIARALQTSESWLMTGEDPEAGMAKPIDRQRHQKATVAAVQALEVSGLQLMPDALSDMIIRLYELQDQEHGKGSEKGVRQ